MPVVNELGFIEPMKLTIVGNGFDIAIGAKTTYNAFYDCLKDGWDAKTFDDFKKKYLYEGNEKLVDSFYKTVKNNQNNFFINYFLRYKTVFGDWVSFEKELTKIVKGFDDLVTFLNLPDRLIVFPSSSEEVSRAYIRAFDNIGLLQVLSVYPNNRFFSTDLKQHPYEGNKYLSFQIKGKKYKDIFSFYNRVEVFSQELPKELFDDLTVFSTLFSVYLGIVDHFVKPGYKLNGVDRHSLFVNYNFTHYLERLVEDDKSGIRRIININGLIDNAKGSYKENIVFGIDSDTQLSNHQFGVFTKRIQRSIKETDVMYLEKMLSEKIGEIEVIGHSLNLADYESLSLIFSRIRGSNPIITVYYFDNESKNSLIINLEQILGKDRFDKYQREKRLQFIDSKKAWER